MFNNVCIRFLAVSSLPSMDAVLVRHNYILRRLNSKLSWLGEKVESNGMCLHVCHHCGKEKLQCPTDTPKRCLGIDLNCNIVSVEVKRTKFILMTLSQS